MSDQPTITFSPVELPQNGTAVLLSAAPKKHGKLTGELDKLTGGQLKRGMELLDFKGGKKDKLDLLVPNGCSLSRVLVVGAGDLKDAQPSDWLALGGRIAGYLKGDKADTVSLILEPVGDKLSFSPEACAEIASGFRLRGYKFDRYKSKKAGGEDDQDRSFGLKELKIGCKDPEKAAEAFEIADAVRGGVVLARDLVNEPANLLGPEEFAARAIELEALGIEVKVLEEEEMQELGMEALLAVGRGSERPSKLVAMHWYGSGSKRGKPVAIIGKGVCFDTGGISIKPSQGMEDMKGDMGGAACVTGLMKALAARRSKANVVGIIGLVENMPDGKALRPGDVVASMSKQTIEVLNTDAEGRLVLADALWYAKETYRPKIMIDLATLTGAILVALGKEYAGLFSNDDKLVRQLEKAGETTGEKVWRLPLGEAYDKMIDSTIADMKNLGGRYAGSITAAQFLQRYVGDIAWAHLDVAGTAMASPKSDINESWGAGYGVRLLDELIRNHYE